MAPAPAGRGRGNRTGPPGPGGGGHCGAPEAGPLPGGAPRLYLLLLAVSLGVSLVYLLAGSAVVGELLLNASTLASLVGSGVMLPVNRIYFRKRESLFAN